MGVRQSVSLCVSKKCMSSDDIVRCFLLHNERECGQNDALCLPEDCHVSL